MKKVVLLLVLFSVALLFTSLLSAQDKPDALFQKIQALDAQLFDAL